MPVIEAKVKKWGNSMGVIIPKDVLEHEHIKENDVVHIVILKDASDVLAQSFGRVKRRKSAQRTKDDLRRELYG